MDIEYTYTQEEYAALNRARNRNGRWFLLREGLFWLIFAVNAFFAIWLLWLILAGQAHYENLWLLNGGIALLMLAVRYVAIPMQRRWYLRQQLMENQTVHLSIDEAGIRGSVIGTRTEADWSAIIRAQETTHHFLLWINKMQAYSVPKSALTGPNSETQLRELIETHVNNVQLKP